VKKPQLLSPGKQLRARGAAEPRVVRAVTNS
jgi:hypothetical protein